MDTSGTELELKRFVKMQYRNVKIDVSPCAHTHIYRGPRLSFYNLSVFCKIDIFSNKDGTIVIYCDTVPQIVSLQFR